MRDKLFNAFNAHTITWGILRDKWENENEGEHRELIRMMVDLFAAHTPRTQLIDEYKWIPTYGAVVGIRDEALDMLANHPWTGFTQARVIVAELVAYVTSTRFYIIDTREVQRALDLGARA